MANSLVLGIKFTYSDLIPVYFVRETWVFFHKNYTFEQFEAQAKYFIC